MFDLFKPKEFDGEPALAGRLSQLLDDSTLTSDEEIDLAALLEGALLVRSTDDGEVIYILRDGSSLLRRVDGACVYLDPQAASCDLRKMGIDPELL